MSKRTVSMIMLLAAAYIADAGPAFAYIDPGTASILLQGIVGGTATFFVVIRLYGSKAKRKILAIFGRDPAKENHNTPAAE
jgi:hypothetical protein